MTQWERDLGTEDDSPPRSVGKPEARRRRVRKNENAKTWYRRERVFTSNGSWYFHTREGMDVGPFACQFDAELEADMLISRLRQAPMEHYDKIIRNRLLDAQVAAGTLSSPAFTDYLVEVGGIEILRKESTSQDEPANG